MAATLMLKLWWLFIAPVEAVLGTDPNGVTSALTGAQLLVTLGKPLCFAGPEFPSPAVCEDRASSAVRRPAAASCWGGTGR